LACQLFNCAADVCLALAAIGESDRNCSDEKMQDPADGKPCPCKQFEDPGVAGLFGCFRSLLEFSFDDGPS
jgi:hypothetical protein